MSLERIIRIAAASVPIPPTGKFYRFIDTDGILKTKDDAGVVQNIAPAVAANGITNALLAQIPTLTIKGNNTGGTANVIDLTVAQVTAMLNIFTATLNGLVPLSGGGVVNFLSAAGTWINPLPTVLEVLGTSTLTTASASDVVLTGVTLTPTVGTYVVDFTTYITNSTNDTAVTFSVYVNGVQVASTIVENSAHSTRAQNVSVTSGKIAVTGTQAIDIRWRTAAGTASAFNRVFRLTQVKP